MRCSGGARVEAWPESPRLVHGTQDLHFGGVPGVTLRRYLTWLIWACVIPVLALAMTLGYLQFSTARDDDAQEAQRMAKIVADEVDQMLRARIAGLHMLATSPLLSDEARWSELHQLAQGYVAGFDSHVALVDRARQLRLHSAVALGDTLPPLPRPAGRSAVQAVFETGQVAVGDAVAGPIANEPLVAIAVPSIRDQRTVAVWLGLMRVRQLEPVFSGLDLPSGWTATLLDSHGAAIATRRGAMATSGVTRAIDSASADDMSFAQRLELVPWSVEVRIPRVTYVQHLTGVASLLVLALLGVTAFSVLAGQWAARRLARAVGTLTELKPQAAPIDDIEEIRVARLRLDDALAQRESAARALAMSEAQLRGIFESANEAIITADDSQTIVLANPAAAQIFGRPIEALVGMPLADLIPVRFRDRHAADVERFAMAQPRTRAMGRRAEVLGLRANGEEFPVEASISQVHEEGRRLYTVILRDVSAQRQAAAAVSAATGRLAATLESMADALLIVDTHGRVVEVNSAFVRMYRLRDKADALRTVADYQQLLELSTSDGQLISHEQWRLPRALRGEVSHGVELRVLHKDTGHSWIGSFSFAPVRDTAGAIIGAVFLVRDVTEQKRLQAELEASHADLERLVASQQQVQEEERKRIARELHDELQQTLAAIKIDVQSIESELAADPARLPPLVSRLDELAGAAITASRRIINDLRPLVLEDLGLVPALELLCRQFAQRTGMAAALECDESLRHAAFTETSAICLYRVAQESLNNVAKHSGAKHVVLNLAALATGGVSLQVRDDGRGMRASDRRKSLSHGLLGMSERVRALGGSLRIDSALGAGVRLMVDLGPHALEQAADK